MDKGSYFVAYNSFKHTRTPVLLIYYEKKQTKNKIGGSKTEFKLSQQSLSYCEFAWHLKSLNKSLILAIHLNASAWSMKGAIDCEHSLFSGLVFICIGYLKLMYSL